jgi:lytic murein transglycosylase
MKGEWRVALRWTIGWTLAGAAALALGPAEARDVAPVRHSIPPVVKERPLAAVTAAVEASAAAQAQPAYGFDQYKVRLAALARNAGVREVTIQANVPTLEINSRAISLDQQWKPSPTSSAISPFEPYRRKHVTSFLINRGQSRYSALWPQLQSIYARYGVDPSVLMAIYGQETNYGSITGGFDLLDVLASLAYEGRRRDMFEDEFVAALKLIDLGVPRYKLKGSYAGATGYPQFMPTVALRLRADGDGDGFADLWANQADGLASIANYMRDAGWKPGVSWGIPVRTPATLNRTAIRNHVKPPRCPRVYERHSRWLTVGEWRALGVTPLGRSLPDSEMATLLEPDGPNDTAYLLTANYRVILDYNCSNFYALSVALLADAIARR